MESWICSLMAASVFERTPVRVRQDGEFTLVMPLETLNVHLLNSTAAELYELIDGKRTLSELVATMQGRYSAEDKDKLRSELSASVRDLEAYGLVQLQPSI